MGDWPHQAPLGYTNNKATRLVELDANKAPLIQRLFELYSSGKYSLSRLRDKIHLEGLASRTGKRLSKSMVEAILKNPFYYGEFVWSGNKYIGNHKPVVGRELFEAVNKTLKDGSKAKGTKKSFAFSGLLKCARCGCRITAEVKKGKYIYYHCTNAKGKCAQPYVREETLDGLFADIVKQVRISDSASAWIIKALKESSKDEKSFREKELMRLQKRYDSLQSRLDKAYEDKLDGLIDDAYWKSVSDTWRSEQDRTQGQMEKYQKADRNYIDHGLQILELANRAYSLYLQQDLLEKRKLLDCLLSNCTLKETTLYPTYNKPFDLIAEGRRNQFKLPRQDSNLRPAD